MVFLLQTALFILFVLYALYVRWLMAKTLSNFLGESPMNYLRKATWSQRMTLPFRTLFTFFRYGWNMVDMMIIIFFFSHIGIRFNAYWRVTSTAALAPDVLGDPETFMPFSNIITNLQNGNNILSLLAIIMWGKLFKYLCMSSYFRFLVRVLERCAWSLLNFALVLLVVFFAFGVAFFVGYGGAVQNFSTLLGSFLVLFFLLIDGFVVLPDWFQPGKDQAIVLMFVIYIVFIYFMLLNIFIAIVLNVYATSGHLRRDETGRENPMLLFVWTYYNAWRGRSLVREQMEENLTAEDLSIRVELLPGIVRRKWVEKKRRMQRVANENFAGMELFPEEVGTVLSKKTADADWTLPSTKNDVLDTMNNATMAKPVVLYDVPQQALQQEISLNQLQRLIDEDHTMPILLGSKKAANVIRRFKRPQDQVVDGEAVTAVKTLQGSVFGKIDALEKPPPLRFDGEDTGVPEVPEVPEITEITEEMSGAITDVRNQFRNQLTSIIEATAELFEHLVELTQGMDAVRENNRIVMEAVKEAQLGGGAGSMKSGSH